MKILSSIVVLSALDAATAGKHKHQKGKAPKEHSTLRGGKEKKAKVQEALKGDKHKKKAKAEKPLSLSLPHAAAGGKPKKAKGAKDLSLSLPENVRGDKHREKKFESGLITRKSLKPREFGPKHKAELCDTLTSSVLLFDVDSSGGLDWDEFQVFNTAIVDVVMDHAVDGMRQLQNEDTNEDLGMVYHDMTCQCHYTFGHPIKCCREEKQEEDTSPVQVSFQGLDVNGEGKSEEDKKYRRNFCDGVMYLLQSEGIDLETANDAILQGLNMDVVDWDIIDTEEVPDATADSTEETKPSAIAEEESLESIGAEEDSVESIVEWVETAEESEVEIEESAETESENTDSEISEQANEIEESASSSTLASKNIDASASSIASASTTDQANDDSDNKSALAAGATIGIAFAFILVMLAIVLAVIRKRKVEEKRRLTAFAGEELIDDDVEANSVHNDIMAIEKLGDQEIEVSPTEAVSEENDDNSDAMSVVSLDHQQECAQISFVDDTEGAIEANVSTLAAMGVASTVTSRLSSQQPAVSPSKSLETGTF